MLHAKPRSKYYLVLKNIFFYPPHRKNRRVFSVPFIIPPRPPHNYIRVYFFYKTIHQFTPLPTIQAYSLGKKLIQTYIQTLYIHTLYNQYNLTSICYQQLTKLQVILYWLYFYYGTLHDQYNSTSTCFTKLVGNGSFYIGFLAMVHGVCKGLSPYGAFDLTEQNYVKCHAQVLKSLFQFKTAVF